MSVEQLEISQPTVEHVWLDLCAAPDEKTGIQRLKITLVINGEHRKELYNSYYKEGLVMHSFNLTLLLNGLKERLAIATRNDDSSSVHEALLWCEEYFLSRDRMNAKIHCAPLRLSPITKRVLLALGRKLPEE